ncbi:MAG: hypothetical protein WCC82_10725 [Nitrososphaeraceae archaeon]
MTSIPMSIIEYINDNSKYPAGVIGCRAAEGNVSYSCCEYDVAVFCDKNRPDLDKVITLNGVTLEFIPFYKISETNYIHIRNMILIKDYDSFLISSLLTKLREKKYEGMLKNYGKRKIIESLFLNQAIIDNLSECPLLSSLWLKLAAYYFVEGILGLNGIKSSPVHELDQIRDLDLKDPDIATGINCALDCIGIERAGRSAISRSLSAIGDLDKDRVHKNLWLAKSQWLLSQGKFADCYHYIGKVGITYLLAKEERFLRRNIKVIETLLDLTSDSQTNHILHTQLVKASKDALRT